MLPGLSEVVVESPTETDHGVSKSGSIGLACSHSARGEEATAPHGSEGRRARGRVTSRKTTTRADAAIARRRVGSLLGGRGRGEAASAVAGFIAQDCHAASRCEGFQRRASHRPLL
jgi:hypothetical protein